MGLNFNLFSVMYSLIYISGYLYGFNVGLGSGNFRVWIIVLIIVILNKSTGSKSF